MCYFRIKSYVAFVLLDLGLAACLLAPPAKASVQSIVQVDVLSLQFGNEIWKQTRIFNSDTAPLPWQSGHEPSWAVENGYGYNIPYYAHWQFKVYDLNGKYLRAEADFGQSQRAMLDDLLDDICESLVGFPISPYKVGEASMRYNCHALASGHTSVWIDYDKYFLGALYFMHSDGQFGPVDWRSPQQNEVSDVAGHRYSNFNWYEHSSLVTHGFFELFRGKYGMHAEYLTFEAYPEALYGPPDHYKKH